MRVPVRALLYLLIVGIGFTNPSAAFGDTSGVGSHAGQTGSQAACMAGVAELLSSGRLGTAKSDPLFFQASSTIQRDLSEAQQSALRKALNACAETPCTPEELASQTQLLADAQFSEADISKLRDHEILPDQHEYSWPVAETPGVKLERNEIKNFNPNMLRVARSGVRFGYVIDGQNRLKLVPSSFKMGKDHLLVVLPSHSAGAAEAMLIKESGQFVIDSKTGEAKLEPSSTSDLSPEELVEIQKKLQKEHPSLRFAEAEEKPRSYEKILDCTKIRNSAGSFWKMMGDSMISENAVNMVAIGVGEAFGAGRIINVNKDAHTKNPEGKQDKKVDKNHGLKILAAKTIGSNFGTAVSTTVGLGLTNADVGGVPQFVVRSIVSSGLTFSQKYTTQTVVGGEEGKKTSEKIQKFDLGYLSMRIPSRIMFENFMKRKLPGIVENACMNGSVLRIVLDPRAVRIYEKSAAAIIYYGASKAIINE